MENKINDVLAVVPLTEDGKIVLKQATYLQMVVPCRIFVLNIIPAVSSIQHFFGSRKENELKDEALKKLIIFLKNFYKSEIPENIIPLILMGDLVHTLVGQAQSGDYYFMILKRSLHKKGIPNLLEQNEIDKIIGHSHCPVLSINEDSTPENLKNILIPIDISERTEKKLLWASLLAQKAKAKIHIISALKINIDEQKSLASKNAKTIQEMLLKRGIESEVTVLKVHEKVKHEAILNYIETKNMDMVIIRKHQVASYENTTIGDFAKEIIHRSKVPVFIVSQSQSDIANLLYKHF